MDTKILIGIANAFLKGLSAVLMVGYDSKLHKPYHSKTSPQNISTNGNKPHKNPTIFGLLYLCHSANHGSLHPRGNRKVSMHYMYQLSASLTVRSFFLLEEMFLPLNIPSLWEFVRKGRRLQKPGQKLKEQHLLNTTTSVKL